MRSAQQVVQLIFSLTLLSNRMIVSDSNKPVMGWSSWLHYGCNRDCDSNQKNCIGEWLVNRTAKAMWESGLVGLGYKYLLIDDCWHDGTRDPRTGRYNVSPKQFPSGLRAVSRYVQQYKMTLGLLFTVPCSGTNPINAYVQQAYEYELGLFKVYACSYQHLKQISNAMSTYPSKMSVSCAGNWLTHDFYNNRKNMDWNTVTQTCSSWRVIPGQVATWNDLKRILNHWKTNNRVIRQHAGPNHWEEQLSLEMDRSSWTEAERRTQMVMWCMMSSPLMFSVDVEELDKASSLLLENKVLIAIDQDLSEPAKFLRTISGVQIWIRKLASGHHWALALMNENDGHTSISIKLSDILQGTSTSHGNPHTLINAFNAYKQYGIMWDAPITVAVKPHDTVVYLVD